MTGNAEADRELIRQKIWWKSVEILSALYRLNDTNLALRRDFMRSAALDMRALAEVEVLAKESDVAMQAMTASAEAAGQATGEIAAITEENAASAEQVSAATEEMAAQTDELAGTACALPTLAAE